VASQGRAGRRIDALNGLASGLIAEGRLEDAMKACVRSLQEKETPDAKALFVHLINLGTSYSNRFVRQYLIRALSDPWCRTGQLVPASFALIKSNREVGQCIERAVSSWPAALSKQDLFGSEGLGALAADDLLDAVLENTPAAGLDFEHFLTLARRALLADALSTQATDKPIHRRCVSAVRLRASATSTSTSITARPKKPTVPPAFATQSSSTSPKGHRCPAYGSRHLRATGR